MKLSFQQMENLAEADLIWLFNHAEGDCGIKSNWTAMVNASCYGGNNGYHDHTNSFILNSIAHYRELEKLYKILPIKIQEILYATFADIHLDENVVRLFKKHAGSASCIKNDLAKLCKKTILGISSKEEKVTFSKIRMQSLKNYQEAITIYNKEKYEFKKRNKD